MAMARGCNHYPPPAYDYRIIKTWYSLLKAESDCPTCRLFGVDLAEPIEYHHLDRKAKCDTLSNMVYCRAPLGIVMAETLKCMPLCRGHHVDYHRHERDKGFLREWYNFAGNPKYQAAIDEFHATAWLLAPAAMQQRYVDFLEVRNEVSGKRYDEQVAFPRGAHGYAHRAGAREGVGFISARGQQYL